MDKNKNHRSRHLKSASAWLNKAEQSFDNKEEIRGELNLILAQAELTHLREVKDKNKHSKNAMVIAVFIVFLGIGAILKLEAEPKELKTELPKAIYHVEELKTTKTESNIKEEALEASKTQNFVANESHASSPALKAGEVNIQNSKIGVSDTLEPEVQLSRKEMNQLIRAADKSLRGQ